MKHLLLLPLLAIAISVSCIAEDGTQPVYDMENHELTSNESYYVLPAKHGTGGGLRMGHIWRRCNYLVSQAPNDTHHVGTPVRFGRPNDHSSRKVLLSTNITVKFDTITTCIQPMYWSISYFWSSSLSEPRRGRVAVGKDEGATYPLPLTSEFVFRIERYDDGETKGYKLVSCAGEGPCKDLGMHASGEKTSLAMSDSPLVVVFKKKGK